MSVLVGSVVGGNWTATGTWVSATVPTSTDDTQADATSGNITINSNAVVAKSFDTTGYTGTLVHNGSITATIGSSTPGLGNIALKLVPTMTYATGSALSTFAFVSTSATVQTVDTGGNTMGTLSFSGSTGSWQLVSDVTAAGSISVSGGTFDANNRDVTVGSFSSSNSNARTIKLGSGTWTVTSSGTVWNLSTSTNATIAANTATIIFTDASANAKTLAFGSKVYGSNIVLSGGPTGNTLIQGNNTFNSILVNPGTKMSIQTGNVQIVSSFSAMGTPGNPIAINNATQTGIIQQATGTVICDYLILQNSTVRGGATFYAGINSIDNGGNVGWIFNIGALNVSDAVTTSENVQIKISDPQVAVSDSIVITEPINMYAQNMVADFAHITEQVTMQVPVIFLQTSDSVTTSESFTVVNPLYKLSVSDSATTSEALAITAAADTPLIHTSDHVLIQEGYKPLYNGFGATYFGNLYGEVQNYGNNTQVVIALVIQVSDTTHVIEVFDIGSLSNTAYDTVTVTDSPSFYSDLVATREQISIRIQQFTTAQSDTVTITEVIRVHAPQLFMVHEVVPIIMSEPIVIPIILEG